MIGAQLFPASIALGGAGSATLEQPLAQAIELAPEAAAGCLEERRLQGYVRLWLGRSRVPADVHVTVLPSPRLPKGVTIEIAQGDARRERTFDPLPDDCAEAHAALGLAIALALDADALTRFAESQAGVKTRRKRLVSAELGAGYHALPGASVGARAGIEAEWLSWLSGRLDLFAHYSPNNSLGPSAGRYDAMALAASSQACMGGRATTALRLALCAGAGAGALHVQGRHYAASASDTGAWIFALSTLRAVLQLGIPWVIDLDLIAPLYMPSIHVERDLAPDRVRQPDVAGAMLSLGPGFQF